MGTLLFACLSHWVVVSITIDVKCFENNKSNYGHCVLRIYSGFPGLMSFKSMLLTVEVMLFHFLLSFFSFSFFWRGVARLKFVSFKLS